ncbi:MAG: hypothetical protein JJW00_09850 [Sulfurimonas sp.]|nr:hypothetical protein [Sulfurimonas sp.]
MKELDFSLATTTEIMKELSRRAKQKRRQDMQYYGDQKKFAKHIGMTYRRYQQFEINGKITIEKFIDVLRGLDALDEIQGLLQSTDEDLFKQESAIKTTKTFDTSKNEQDSKKIDKDEYTKYVPDLFR